MRKFFLLGVSVFMIGVLTLVVSMPAQALLEGSKQEACKAVNFSEDATCDPNAGSSVSKTVKLGLNILSVVVGIAAVIVMILGGLKYITSGGDANSVGAAKNTIMYAAIGLVIVALAQFIVRFVIAKSQA